MSLDNLSWSTELTKLSCNEIVTRLCRYSVMCMANGEKES